MMHHVQIELSLSLSIATRTSHCICNIWQKYSQDCLGNLVSVNWMRGGAHPRAYDSAEISLELCTAPLDSDTPHCSRESLHVQQLAVLCLTAASYTMLSPFHPS